jgi:lipoprotein-anchoring transpeptidase ErfK/SrfK
VTFRRQQGHNHHVISRRVLAIALVGALAGVACTRASADPPPTAPTSLSASPVAHLARAEAPEPPPVLPKGTFVARSRTPWLTVWPGPSVDSGKHESFSTRNPVGQTLEFLVARATRDDHGDPWLRIYLPVRPNGTAAWVRMGAVTVRRIQQRIVVDLSEKSLRYYRDGHLQHDFSVGIGRPETPTAVGTFFVWAQVPQASPSGPYGVFALGLSGFSPVLLDWPGGGRMAIHGTTNPGDLGQMVSHGCVRVYNDDMVDLRRVPLGTPVVIKH